MIAFDKAYEKILSISEKNQNAVIGGMVFGIILIFCVIGIGPQLATLNKVNPQIMVLSKDIEKAQNDILRIANFQKQLKQLEEKLASLNELVKTREDVPHILEGLSVLANSHNVLIDQMMPLMDSQKLLLENSEGKYFSLPILIEARSGYHNLGRFLSEMEDQKGSLAIERFTLRNSKNDILLHPVRITLQAIIFEKEEATQ